MIAEKYHSCPTWVAAAARRPIAFAQVREDALIDQWVVDQVGANAKMMMVASGGCTAAALAASGKLSHLHLVDPNPAQIALTRLKLRLVESCFPEERIALLGHARMDAGNRARRLAEELINLGLPADVLGPIEWIAEVGPDHAGRYEAVFAELRRILLPEADELTRILNLNDPVPQAALVAPHTHLGRAFDAAFALVMSQENLVQLFGAEATNNRAKPFAQHFADRTRESLARSGAADNPYLWQVLQGRFPPKVVPRWLAIPCCSKMPSLEFSVARMADVLAAARCEFDIVHLSNILDWLSPENARITLELAGKVLRPGGWVVIRQLNSTLKIRDLGDWFQWEVELSDRWHAADRSYFYRALHFGRKR
jgi:S-adenosylmethionine-diacylglycerol 3-amino-3-carboxypropyl transferase